MKFEEAYKKYLIYIENRQKIQSKKDLKEKFENKILPFFKDYNIYEISELDYMEWQNEIEKCNYKNNSKSNLHYLMSGFFNYCQTFHKLDKNVAKIVGNFKMENVKIKRDYYTLKEYKKFIKCMDNVIYKTFFEFIYFTGTRPGEAMALKFSDLNSNRTIEITKSISEHSINGKRHIDTPKSQESVRKIKIDKKLYKSLVKLKSLYTEKNINDQFIFGGNKPIAPTTINRYKKEACKKANIRPIELRAFRRSHASLLNEYNVPISMIKERLGHSNVNITMKYYIQTYEEKEKRVIKTLNLIRLFH